jgi:hypothetical protein
MKHLAKQLLVFSMMFSLVAAFAQDKRSLNNYREPSKDGLNVFESPKDTSVVRAFEGVKVRIGGSSSLQFQTLDHENGRPSESSIGIESPWFSDDGEGGNANLPLKEIGSNFNLATANLDIDVTLADGLRMHLRTYLSSRHHPEPYVKGGYLQVDNLNWIGEGTLDELMKYITVKLGHMEVNYGDMHFRRSDNSQALYNPFVGNTILDAFTTEVAGEIYYRRNSWIAMVGLTNGKLNQAVDKPETTSPSIVGKLGYDKQVSEDFRFRLTGSVYSTSQTSRAYLFNGDRAGSRYYLVLGNPTKSAKDDFKTGRYDPGFNHQMTAIMFNPFVKYGGFEFFGMVELVSGRSTPEKVNERNWTQLMGEALYRFGNKENFYVAARYNTASGEDASTLNDITIDRFNFGGGVFFTKNVLAKIEYVNQTYDGFDPGNRLNEGKFNGVVIETIISF